MKKYIYPILLLTPLCVFSQVGIKTTTPQQGLHVGGAVSTVKIDGLAYPANPNNLGPGTTSRVFVNANGDLILGTAQNNIAILFDAENYLRDERDPSINQIIQHGYGDGFEYSAIPRDIPNSTFTLTEPAIIEINYSVSWDIEKNATTRVNDGHARAVQTMMYFRKDNYLGPVVTTDIDGNLIGGAFEIDNGTSTIGGGLGLSGQYYTNHNDDRGETNNYHNCGTDYVKLPPGTYCPMFSAQLAVSAAGGSGAMKMYLGTGNDEVQIVAHYYQ
ncbi:hypothetical protein FEDK69T_07060 [Flavobacterium enshiense DK69]|uniref:Uncharacterized protein n=1 Tax=Flavobacterium enshiense DK69 TaxID=1107311 RepID=V6SIN5_9FLAO|nr:hypothetical protein [Flavobacterium enshiense]ESU24265.1 hypothetical protein FEDK69T_07060 [Flavobacterium enshiense DK69]KGO95361.1 hypothetical protein Q767_11175 [Flavobacterium enshiense DK69]